MLPRTAILRQPLRTGDSARYPDRRRSAGLRTRWGCHNSYPRRIEESVSGLPPRELPRGGSNRNAECCHFPQSACYPSRLLRFGLWARPQLGSCGQPLSYQSSIEELNLVPSILLDPIHCRVCTLDQSLAIPTVVWKDADPYAGGDMKNVRLEVMRGRECRENLVRDWQQTS